MTRKIITASNKKDKKISNERMIQDNPFLESQKIARTDIESQLGQSVISPLNASDKPALEVKTDSDGEKD